MTQKFKQCSHEVVTDERVLMLERELKSAKASIKRLERLLGLLGKRTVTLRDHTPSLLGDWEDINDR